ncbi:dipeptide ABC transporter ATP-binding protein [Promicromonospora iranensis]|uniref:Peptide/nickel transport system ATP-binding protein n=1 Tax=Promicromonospora iranensis TaxID=1105144 RepID=A0ABU2CVU8_9MICO|nr:ABC transporter ATP-binding protein [Promicromonospora iranensis]MDR7385469.1 peptide/nickel transport system ATP-binding protein [Promicromonospora iranensis]
MSDNPEKKTAKKTTEPTTAAPVASSKADSAENVVLRVEGLCVDFRTENGAARAVSNANLTVERGQTVAIVGESGSGKTTLAMAVLGLLASNGSVAEGHIWFKEEDLGAVSPQRMAQLRGTELGLVPQDPMTNLDPIMQIGRQIDAGLIDNGLRTRRDARTRTVELLEEVGLPDARARAAQYPHEFSGGMRQRALIAMGLSGRPALLVADEPTSALDVTVQRGILDQLSGLTEELGTAVLLITHDLGLAAERADTVVVMYRGDIVEQGPARQVLTAPQHEYTKRLMAAAPSLASRRIEIARERGLDEVLDGALLAHGEETAAETDVLVSVKDVSKVFSIRGKGLFSRSTGFTAVDGVSLDIPRGSTVAVVGESGSGKSTLARMILDIEKPTTGSITFDGGVVGAGNHRDQIAYRRRVQPVFQDPYSSLDPLYSVFRAIEEPLRAHDYGDAAARRARVEELADQVALSKSQLRRFPSELSGGQRQRVAIARALALSPELVVCDEAVSALDVVVQAQILQLLAGLQEELGLTYLFITHDLAVVRQIADRVLVMQEGRVVEEGTVDSVFDSPATAYTRALLDAIPGKDLELAL